MSKKTNEKIKYEKHIDFPFYLDFLSSIYLSKFNNKNRKALGEVCPKLN